MESSGWRVVVKKSANLTDKHVGSRVRMRRLMLRMTLRKLAKGLKLTFQQVQKYEAGETRIGAGRLQQLAGILRVPVEFFFEGAPSAPGQPRGKGDAPDYMSDFFATKDGLALTKAFMQIKQPQRRRRILHLVEEIADDSA
jgi:transcriptional regulator with XRE-family HTH domain